MKRNTIKQYALFTLLCLSFECVIAQEIEVKDICQLTTDISARSEARVSPEGKDCAILRVNLPTIRKMDFKNSIVGDVKYKAGEYMVYIPEGTKQIPFSVEGYNDGIIDFENFNISVEGKCVYRVSLSIQKGNNSIGQTGSLKITTKPESTFILLDGIPVGESPLTIEHVAVGTHTIAFPNTSGYSLPDQTVKIRQGETCEKHFDLVEDESEGFEIPMYANVSDGAYAFPVKYKPIEQNGKKGLTDYWDNIVVPCEFSYVDPRPVDGFFRVMQNVDVIGLYGVYKPEKGLVIPCEYLGIELNEGNPFIRVLKSVDRGGVVRLADGKEMLPVVYESVQYVYNGIYIVEKKEGYQLININKGITSELYAQINQFNEGVGFAEDKNGRLYLIDTLCNVKPLPEDYYIDNWYDAFYTEGIMRVKKKETKKWGVIDVMGTELSPFIIDDLEYGSRYLSGHGFITLCEENSENYMIVDKYGRCHTSNYAPAFCADRYICIYKEGEAGLIDFDWNTVLPFEFDSVEDWGSIIMAKKKGTCFLFDLDLKEIGSFDDIEEDWWYGSAKDGIIEITIRDKGDNYWKYGYMNYNGEFLTGCMYDLKNVEKVYNDVKFDTIFNGLALLCIGNRCGLIDKNGDIVVPLIYSIILPFTDGTVYARKTDGTWIELNVKDYSKS